jgi:hypothetical protein
MEAVLGRLYITDKELKGMRNAMGRGDGWKRLADLGGDLAMLWYTDGGNAFGELIANKFLTRPTDNPATHPAIKKFGATIRSIDDAIRKGQLKVRDTNPGVAVT